MANFQVSLEALLTWCRPVVKMNIPQRLLFFESDEQCWIHYVPRLLVLLEGKSEISYWENGTDTTSVVEAPVFFYCSRSGRFKRLENAPNKALSFSYYPNYIRAMMIDFDGINSPPTARDIYYHTTTPLSEPGKKLLEMLDSLHETDCDEIAKKLLPVLYELTLKDLEDSSSAPVLKVRKLWEEINTFLREHRSEVVSREEVAKLFRISPGYVSELCKKYTGNSFSHLKLRYQLEHAENMLLHSRLSVNEIAEQSGFTCANYFIRRFKGVYGVTPHVYRNHPPSK